jgi:NADPH-dependent stearoyl-CoA 9-desaturase
MLAASLKRSARWAGTLSLGLAKVIENVEIGHNVMHGQWNWMNDPEIHSSTWEWDISGASKHWQSTHNFQHHKYTNILGMDHDVGYSTPTGRPRPALEALQHRQPAVQHHPRARI